MPPRDGHFVIGDQDHGQDRRQDAEGAADRDGLSPPLLFAMSLIQVVKTAAQHRRGKTQKFGLQLPVPLFFAVGSDVAAKGLQDLPHFLLRPVGRRFIVLLEADLLGECFRGFAGHEHGQNAVDLPAAVFLESADFLHTPDGVLVVLGQDDDQIV